MTPTLSAQEAPHIHHRENTRGLMLDVMLVLAVLYAMAFYFYGLRTLVLGLFSAAVCVVLDLLCCRIYGREINSRDLSAVVTGLIIPLMMPACIPYYVVATAGFVAIVAAKQPFGGTGHNVFNPAAAGFSFAAICFSQSVFTYSAPLIYLPVFGTPEIITAISPAASMSLGGVPAYEIVDMALGNFAGPMGATNILVMLACLLYLVFRGAVRWETPVSFLLTAMLFALLFPRTQATGLASAAYELMSGMLLFGAVILLGDPATSPKRSLSRAAYGVLAGIVVMLFRRYGNLEEGVVFAVLLVNAAVWGLDLLAEHVYASLRRKRLEAVNGKKV